MTAFGKILVMLNLVASLGFMAWALSLSANRVDWPEEYARRVERIDDPKKTGVGLWNMVRPVEADWRSARTGVLALEEKRPDDRSWYAAELKYVLTGSDPAKPQRQVVYDRGVPVPDPEKPSRPKMEPVRDRKNQPLQAIASYESELDTLRENFKSEMQKHTELVEQDTRLTEQLVGKLDPAGNRVLVKGLRQKIIDEHTKYQDLMKEQELAKPLLVNAFIESQLILKRAEALKARIAELEKRVNNVAAGGER